ncbi:hypothetical protein M3J09_010946 [Ascochyta lentis]
MTFSQFVVSHAAIIAIAQWAFTRPLKLGAKSKCELASLYIMQRNFLEKAEAGGVDSAAWRDWQDYRGAGLVLSEADLT